MSDTPPVPEILTFAMSGGLFAAVINLQTDPDGSNIAARQETQLVLAPTQNDLNSRCISALIGNFGLTQDEADQLVPAQMITLTAA